MRQTTLLPQAVPAAIAACLLLGGCSKSPDTAAGASPAAGGIVSLSPAATDLLVAMNLGDRVVAVSQYDANETMRKTLPKVGDYERIDWERVAALRPAYLVIQGRKDRMPAGQRERCQGMGITPVILQIDRLVDVRAAMVQLGEVTGEKAKAAAAVAEFDRRTAALEAARPATPTPTLLTFSDGVSHVVGTQTFLDDALVLAGGSNVLTTPGYPTIDREKLATLHPAAVFLLMPGARPASTQQARGTLGEAFPSAAVHSVTDDTALMPGTCALTLAETMARRLKEPQ